MLKLPPVIGRVALAPRTRVPGVALFELIGPERSLVRVVSPSTSTSRSSTKSSRVADIDLVFGRPETDERRASTLVLVFGLFRLKDEFSSKIGFTRSGGKLILTDSTFARQQMWSRPVSAAFADSKKVYGRTRAQIFPLQRVR